METFFALQLRHPMTERFRLAPDCFVNFGSVSTLCRSAPVIHRDQGIVHQHPSWTAPVPTCGTQKIIGAMTRPRERMTSVWFLANPWVGSRHGRIEMVGQARHRCHSSEVVFSRPLTGSRQRAKRALRQTSCSHHRRLDPS
jgi:hypothetical protein